MAFKLFDYLDHALETLEKRNDFTSKTARIWPSEASAVLLEPGATDIVGGCHRRTFYRLIGEKTTGHMDAIGARRVRTGKSVEDDTTFQAITAGIHITSGCRMWVPHLDLAFELDLVVLDPKTTQPVICENKSIYGYMAAKEIIGNKWKSGRPKLEHLMQTLIYINEIRTGGHLKQVIEAGLANKAEGNKRNRIRVTEDNVAMIPEDSKIYGKICYETRDTCETKEFDIDIYEDFDGLHYPTIDGKVCQIFTIESIYERFSIIQKYFNIAQAEAIKRLEDRGVNHPIADKNAPLGGTGGEQAAAEFKELEKKYWVQVGEEMRRLGPEFLPPAEYRYKYSEQKIEALHAKELIGETKYKEWKSWKTGKTKKWKGSTIGPIIGDWQCRYCPFKMTCIAQEYPELKHMAQDLMHDDDEAEVEGVV